MSSNSKLPQNRQTSIKIKVFWLFIPFRTRELIPLLHFKSYSLNRTSISPLRL